MFEAPEQRAWLSAAVAPQGAAPKLGYVQQGLHG